jgi:hypothetical protein
MHLTVILTDGCDLIVEHIGSVSVYQQPHQLATQDLQLRGRTVAVARARRELGLGVAAPVDEARADLAGARLRDALLQAHPPYHLAPRAAHIDILPRVAQRRGSLEHRDRIAVAAQPRSERCTSNACARNQDGSTRGSFHVGRHGEISKLRQGLTEPAPLLGF